jgi:hypothetical protein
MAHGSCAYPSFVTLGTEKFLQNLKMLALSAFPVLFPNIGCNL